MESYRSGRSSGKSSRKSSRRFTESDCLESELGHYSTYGKEHIHILDNKTDYHTLHAILRHMPIKRIIAQDSCDCYQAPIHATDHS